MNSVKSLISKLLTRENLVFLGAVVAGMLLVVVSFDQIIMPWYTKHEEALAVPNVVAQPFESAKELLEMQGLSVVKQGEKHDPNMPFGYVVDQNPRASRLVKKGRRVYVTISVGEREMEVPNLVGLSETNAEETLKSAGLRAGERDYRYVIDELPKVVIEQSPPAKTFVKQNSTVDITVSLGEPVANVIVPSVLGKTLETARREIQKAGLTFGRINYRLNNELLPNTVIEQSLKAGTSITYGDTINVVVTAITKSNR
ncbi:MAG TPA: PASTA domain-containing protein [bacterium]